MIISLSGQKNGNMICKLVKAEFRLFEGRLRGVELYMYMNLRLSGKCIYKLGENLLNSFKQNCSSMCYAEHFIRNWNSSSNSIGQPEWGHILLPMGVGGLVYLPLSIAKL